jgi:flagellar motility protein MotE (MotC chaperone)
MAERRPTAREGQDRGQGRPSGVRIALAVVLAGKLVLAGLWTHRAFANPSAAAPAGRPGTAAAVATASGGDGQGEAGKPVEVRGLLEGLARRQAELDAREQELAEREERMKLYEKDVTAKIASLEEIEKRLQARAKAASAAVDAAAESLAKVYGAMKPADAAPILERLDEPTVLTIFGRMKEKQIGEILPLMSREKAIVLTRSLAERR